MFTYMLWLETSMNECLGWFEYFITALFTPLTLIIDILTLPFQIFAIIIFLITNRKGK